MNFKEMPVPVVKDPELVTNYGFIDSPIVPIQESDKIEIKMMYPILGCKNGEPRCMARKEVADMLYQAAEQLPEGYHFRMWDVWRPFALQEELTEFYWDAIMEEFHMQDASYEEQKEFIAQFVATPIRDEEQAPAHTTGGAMDLTIVGPDGKELPMGTEFDSFTENTRSAYYETAEAEADPAQKEIRDNRRWLINLMESVGFTNLPSEWWHFDYGDKNWAYITGNPILYKGIFEID